MSGIAGIFNAGDQAVSETELRRLVESLVSTSPDGSYIWTSQQIGLGHAFLRTRSGESGSQQIFVDESLHVVCDARIDDRQKLSEKLHLELKQTGVRSQPPLTDAELIAQAYKAWGTDCVRHIIGDFVLAIWDANLEQLFCARDQLGVKQFFYYYDGKTFVFSNSLTTVRLHPLVSDELNELAVADFFLFGLNQEPTSTVFADIHRLPRAHSLVVSKSKLVIREYWQLSVGEVRYKTNDEYIERFGELFDQAVSDRSQTENVAISMSGGLDSTAIAESVVRQLRTNIHAYCVLYEKAFRDDERGFARHGVPVCKLSEQGCRIGKGGIYYQ